MIEVFVCSRSTYSDVTLAREMTQHVFCHPDTAFQASIIFGSKFKGRLLPEEDMTVLERITEKILPADVQMKIYDVSAAKDKFKAFQKGVTKTPVIIVDGEKYEGLKECLDIIDRNYHR